MSIVDLLFGCRHRKLSKVFSTVRADVVRVDGRVQVRRNRRKVEVNGTKITTHTRSTAEHYVVCLDCGKEFEYDWRNMKMGPELIRFPHMSNEVPEGTTELA